MAKRSDLLAQIATDVAGNKRPLSSLLQTCIVLGGSAGSEKMRDWARRELDGYDGSADSVPDYRHVHAVLMAVITNNAGYNGITQRIQEDVFPRQIRDLLRETVGDIEDVPLPYGIGMLEGLASQGTDAHHLSPPWSSVMADTLNRYNMAPNSRVAQVYWSVSNAAISSVLVRVRASLADTVAELNTMPPQDQDDIPDRQATAQEINLMVTGHYATFHFGDTQIGDTVTNGFGSEYNFGDITGNVAAGSSNVTQNYNASFDITKVREFAEAVAQMADMLGLDADQQADLTAAITDLDEAVSDSAGDKGRMRRAVDAVMGYLKPATNIALRNAAMTFGTQAGNELDAAIRHMHGL
jgi:hypothetical protein